MARELEQAKRRLRRDMARRRRRVPPDAAAAAGRAVAERLAASEAFTRARRVALYAALPDEMPTRPCFEAVIAAGKVALLPRQRARGLSFHAVTRWEELRPGPHGVLEPAAGAPAVDPRPGDVVLVPGVAFDARGGRLGRGGGAYDATFPAGTGGPLLVGVAYEVQLVEAVPRGSHDRRMDAIVTERSMRCAGDGS